MKLARVSLIVTSLCTASPYTFAQDQALPVIRVETQAPLEPSIDSIEPDTSDVGLPADSGEWLRSLLGVSGKRLGGHGIDPVVRGQGENRVNILLDGAYVHGGCPNRMDPPTAYAPLSSYDRVTLYKGSQTVRYGGGGSGGTLLLERETAAFADGEAPRLDVEGGYAGNGDRRELYADLAAGNAQGYMRLLAGRGQSNNYEDGDGDSVRSAYTETGANLMLGWTPDQATRLELSLEASRGDDMLFAGRMDAPVSDHDVARIKFERSDLAGPFAAVNAELYHSDVHHVMDNFSLRPLSAAMKMAVPSDSITQGGRISLDYVDNAGSLWVLGADLQHNNREAIRYAGPTLSMVNSLLWPDVTLQQTGLFVETTMDLSALRRLSGGLRYDHVRADADRAAETLMGMLLGPNQLYQLYYGRSAEQQTENNVGGFIKLEQDIQTRQPFTVYANLSRSLRTADATERFMAANSPMDPTLRWVGNPDLDPEQHHQLEFGASARPKDWAITASLYVDYVDDYILRDTARGQAGILRNDGATIYRNVDAKLFGAELQIQHQWTTRWSSEVGLASVRGINRSEDRDLAQIPPLEVQMSTDYERDHWSLGGRIRGAARQTHIDADTATGSGLDQDETAGYVALDLYGRWQTNKVLSLRWGIDNVFDKRYAEHLNRANDFDPVQVQINEPGRSVWAKVGAEF